MNIKLMRSIDYWLGVPLCFLLRLMDCVIRLIPIKKKEGVPAKILFIKLSEMGSIILSYTLIKRVKEEYPHSDIFFLTFKKNKPLVQILGIVGSANILTITEDSPGKFILDTLRTIIRMRKEKMDTSFDLELFSRFTAILTYLSGADKRIGFYRYHFEGLYRGNLLTHNIQYNPLIHISKAFLCLSQTIKLDRKSTPELGKRIDDREIIIPRFNPSEESITQIRHRLSSLGVEEGARLLLINPGEGVLSAREWPLDNFITLSRRLLDDDRRNYIIIVGTEGVYKKAEELRRSIDDRRCLDLAGETTLFEILSLFHISEALIANDCGLAHIASLTPIKKFIIFGPESPQLYSPLGEDTWIIYSNLPCSPCLSAFNHRQSCCGDNRCLKVIETDEVYRLIKTHIQ